MTNAVNAFGTLLKIGDGGGPETFTTIGEVMDIGGPAIKQRTAEVTNHQSTGGWAEHIGTILEGGEVTFAVNYQPTLATHNATTGLLLALKNRVKRNFQLVFPDSGATTWSFTSLVTAFEPKEPVDGQLTADVTLMITGQPTLV